MMMFTDENGNPTGPPDGWTDTGGGDVLSPVKGGPWGMPPPQSSNGNMNGLGLGMIGQSMRPPSNLGDTSQLQRTMINPPRPNFGGAQPAMMSNEFQTHSINDVDPNNPFAKFLATYNQNQNGGPNVASQLPNLNSLMGPSLGSYNSGQVGQAGPMMPGLMGQMAQMGGPQGRSLPAQAAYMGGAQTANQVTGEDATAGADAGTSWWDTFKDQIPGIGEGLAAGASIAGALKAASNTTATGHAMQDYLSSLGSDLNDGSQFQGYGVSTGLGNGSVGYQPQLDADGNPMTDTDGNAIMGPLTTDLGLDPTIETEITNMKNASAGNFTDAANAYNAMNLVNSGQSAADYNATSTSLQTGANGITPGGGDPRIYAQQQIEASQGITPGQGAAGNLFADQMASSQGIAPGQGAFGAQAQNAANRAMADPSQRQGEIYQQMMAMQNPELDRQQGEQQAQEYARGRGGVRGSQYGGTAEDAAMARARATASNQASLSAMQQADSERTMFGQMASQFGQLGNQNFANETNLKNNLANSGAQMGQIGNQNFANQVNQQSNLANNAAQFSNAANQNYANMANYKNQMNNSAAAFGGLGNQADSNAISKMGMLGNMGNQLAQLGQQNYQNSYMPMQQQIEAMKLGMGNADMAQTGQLTGQDYMAQLGLGGANANINAQHSANQLTGNLYNALLANIGGTQGSDGTAGSGLMGLIGGGIEGIGDYFGWGKKDEGGTP